RVERDAELRAEAALVQRAEHGVTFRGRLEPTVEVLDVLETLLAAERSDARRALVLGVRLRVLRGLHSRPGRRLIAAPGDPDRRDRHEEHGDELEQSLLSRVRFGVL